MHFERVLVAGLVREQHLGGGRARVAQSRLGRVNRGKACRLAGLRQRDTKTQSKADTWRAQQMWAGSCGSGLKSREAGSRFGSWDPRVAGLRAGPWGLIPWAFFRLFLWQFQKCHNFYSFLFILFFYKYYFF